MIKIKQTQRQFDFSNIPKVHDMINRVAEMIKQDIGQGVAKGEDISGVKFEKLDPKTIRSKRMKRGGKNPKPRSTTPTKPLLDTHKMVGSGGAGGGGTGIWVSEKASRSKYQAKISIPKDRQKIAMYHNKGKGDLPKREWFGVGKRVIKKVDKAVEEWIKTMYRFRG